MLLFLVILPLFQSTTVFSVFSPPLRMGGLRVASVDSLLWTPWHIINEARHETYMEYWVVDEGFPAA